MVAQIIKHQQLSKTTVKPSYSWWIVCRPPEQQCDAYISDWRNSFRRTTNMYDTCKNVSVCAPDKHIHIPGEHRQRSSRLIDQIRPKQKNLNWSIRLMFVPLCFKANETKVMSTLKHYLKHLPPCLVCVMAWKCSSVDSCCEFAALQHAPLGVLSRKYLIYDD